LGKILQNLLPYKIYVYLPNFGLSRLPYFIRIEIDYLLQVFL